MAITFAGKIMAKRTKRLLPWFAVVAVLASYGLTQQNNAAPSAGSVTTQPGEITVYFSPAGGCTDAIVSALGQAKQTVLVQAYSFTSAPIAKALLDASKRNVTVKVILDKSQRTQNYSEADFLAHAGIPVWIDDRHAIAHNKIMILDGEMVITGSFNFSKAAEEHNAENLLVIRSPELAQKYVANWKEHLGHSVVYDANKAKAATQPTDSAAPPAVAPPSPVDTAAPKSTGDDVVVYATRTGAKYHTAGCRFLAKSSISMTLKEAKAKGLTPCSVCKPPQ